MKEMIVTEIKPSIKTKNLKEKYITKNLQVLF